MTVSKPGQPDTNISKNSELDSKAGQSAEKPSPDRAKTKSASEQELIDLHRGKFKAKIADFHGLRCMKLWEIIMISTGYLPFKNTRDALKSSSKNFNFQYNQRTRFLKGRLTTFPQKGLALLLPHYPGTDTAIVNDQYLDILSAFEVLRTKYANDMPTELRAMEESVVHIPYPPTAHDEVPENKEAKRDISKRISAGINQNMQILFVQLVVDKYGTLTAKTLDGIASVMAKDLKATNLKVDAIKTQLRIALSGEIDRAP